VHILLFWALFQCSGLFAQDIKGKVLDVIDGDTYKLMVNGKMVKVRLLGIDCPEHDQAYGWRATKTAENLVLGKNVTVKIGGKDLYHRVLGTVFLENGTNVCKEMIKSGYAWKYKYSHDHDLEKLESTAKKAKLGLWADPNPVSPWDFKKIQRRKR